MNLLTEEASLSSVAADPLQRGSCPGGHAQGAPSKPKGTESSPVQRHRIARGGDRY